jgi:endo-1,4-beta-mannosidase
MKPERKIRLIATSMLTAVVILVSLGVSLFVSAPAAAGLTVRYDFETNLEGWQINSYSSAITAVQRSCTLSHSGACSMELLLDLRDQANYDSGEVYVEFAPEDFSGKTLGAWIYAPKGARGHPTIANGLHLFVEDTGGRRLYGTWHNMLEGGWFQIVLPVTDTLPACGSIGPGFDPSSVKKIGINIGAGSGAGPAAAYSGSIFIDTISLGTPDPLPSDHLYDFADPNAQTRLPHWDVDPGWGAAAWDELRIENGALVADATFDTSSDSGRKGFGHIIYSPYLNLGHKDHHLVSLDIRFDPPAVAPPPNHCPFVISFWVWDDYKQKWFWSDIQHVGSGDWTTVSFNLDNPAEFAPGVQDYEGDMPTLTDIRQVGIQLYSNVPYSGTVMFDNIVVGGEELPNRYPSQNQGFVQTQGNQFVLNGAPFRFVGVDAEYLFTVREAEVEVVLDAARRMGPTVVRTWGFSEGCEGDETNCVAYSRYFQPERGKWNETAFENFDRLVAMAGERGLRLIVPLVNNWDEYGGIPQYVEWLAEEHPDHIVIPPDIEPGTQVYTDTLHDLFFTNEYTREWYKAYVTAFISRTNRITGIRYVDDPTIFSWEVINEPRAKSDVSGKAIHIWLKEMSDYVRSLDQNHLIGTGEEGWYIKPEPDTRPLAVWQNFPKNYWHYGVNWRPDCSEEENWGSNGSDFISDHASFTTTVKWQEYVGPDCNSPIQSDERVWMPNIDYTSLHLYVAQSESNLYRAPYCDWGFGGPLCDDYNHDYFQAGEWIGQHVRDSHAEIGKPFIVAEFGLRKSETYQGSPGEYPQFVPAFTPEERRQLYRRYLQTMYNAGVNGALIWNLGYDRFNDLIWDGAEALDDWQIDPNSDAVSIALNSSDPEVVSWGSKSVQVNYDPARGYGQAAVDRININQNWASADRARVELDLYNAGNATHAAIALVTGSDETRYESITFTLQSGWNTIEANAWLPYWQCTAPGCQPGSVVEGLDNVRQLSLVLYGYTMSGSAYVDYVRHQGNDSLMIYPDESLFETVMVEARQWFGTSPRVFLPLVLASHNVLLDDFEDGIEGWYAARAGTNRWGPNEVAVDVRLSTDAAVGSGALRCNFDFNLTDTLDPRATCFLAELPVQDWTEYNALRFKAKSLVDAGYNLRAFIALATREDSCWNELGDFQMLSSDYQTFTFDLDRPLYKTCQSDESYDQVLLGKDQVVRLHLIFTTEQKPSGAVVVDEIWLLRH